MLMLINSIYPRANIVTKVTTAAPWGLSSVNHRTILVSTTVTLGMVVVHSNIISRIGVIYCSQFWFNSIRAYRPYRYDSDPIIIRSLMSEVPIFRWNKTDVRFRCLSGYLPGTAVPV